MPHDKINRKKQQQNGNSLQCTTSLRNKI